MDISSGNVSFGRTCPGSLMQNLLCDKPDQVRKITKFQTSLSARELPYQCALHCEDLKTVDKFMTTIDNLEGVSVLNFEPDGSSLWPAIFHHGKSLQSLAIHTPPQTYDHARTWTPATVKDLTSGLPNLRHLEMDIAVEEAESLLTSTSSAQPSSNTRPANSATSESVLDTLAAQVELMPQLNSLLINITLKDEASLLCGEHTWNVMGCISFPQPNTEVCERLAQVLVDKLNPNGRHSDDAAERKRDIKLQVRLARRCWDDRYQFYTLGYSIPIQNYSNNGSTSTEPASDGGTVDGNSSSSWKSYLPPWPEYGGFLWRLVEDYRKESKWY